MQTVLPGVMPGESLQTTIEAAGGSPVELVQRPEVGVVIDLTSELAQLRVDGRVVPMSAGTLPLRQRAMIRCLDLALAVPALIVALPALVAVAVAVKASSTGPVFYADTRYTRNGRGFKMLKFRSMVTNGDEVLAAHFLEHPEDETYFDEHHKLPNDPRVTTIGRMMRRWNIDELPQLWNVVRGQMSVVGPRPLLPSERQRFGAALPVVGRVKSGLTGLWQVSGRSELTFDERILHDVKYVTDRSLRGDVGIIAKTVLLMARGNPGAY